MAQATQSGRQAGTHLPSGEGGSLSQAGSQASQSQVVTSQLGRQACTLLPSGEEGSFSQAGSQASQASQAVTSQSGTHLPLGEGSNWVASQASQAGTPSPKEGSRQAGALHPLRKELA